jgi:hypothetical protein
LAPRTRKTLMVTNVFFLVLLCGFSIVEAERSPGGEPGGIRVNTLLIDPSNPSILYAGTYDGVFRTWMRGNRGYPRMKG